MLKEVSRALGDYDKAYMIEGIDFASLTYLWLKTIRLVDDNYSIEWNELLLTVFVNAVLHILR